MGFKLRFTSQFWLRSLFFTLLQRFSVIFFGFATSLILFRLFDNVEMGIWALFLQIVPTIETVKVGLLRNAMIKFLHLKEFSENKKDVQSASLLINIAFSIVVSIFLVIFAGVISLFLKAPMLTPLLQWSILWILLLIPFNHCEIVQQANLQFRAPLIAYIIRQALYFGGLVMMLFFFEEHLSFGLLLILQIGALLIATIYFISVTKKYLFKEFHYNKGVLIKLLHFGKYVFGTTLFSNLARYTDHFVTANAIGNPVLGQTYVSYYNATSRIIGFIDIPSFALADVLFPKKAEAMEKEGVEKIRYYAEKSLGTNLAVIIPACTIMFFLAHYIVLFLAGPRYLPMVPILQITLLISVLRPFSYQFGYTMDSIGKPRLNFWVNTFALGLSIGLTYSAYKFFDFGIYAAVYANVVCYLIFFAIVYYFLRKELGVRVRHIVHYTIQIYKEIFNILKGFRGKTKPVA